VSGDEQNCNVLCPVGIPRTGRLDNCKRARFCGWCGTAAVAVAGLPTDSAGNRTHLILEVSDAAPFPTESVPMSAHAAVGSDAALSAGDVPAASAFSAEEQQPDASLLRPATPPRIGNGPGQSGRLQRARIEYSQAYLDSARV
jgi:hypothetical protein